MVRFKKSMFTSKSFLVVDGELVLKIIPEDGWYVVEGMNIKGLVTQGRSIEEAIYRAHDAAKTLAEGYAYMAAEKTKPKRRAKKSNAVTIPHNKEIKPSAVKAICKQLNIPLPPEI